MIDYEILKKESIYVDEAQKIADILKELNNSTNLAYLDGELRYFNENADCLALFWYDGEAESWRVHIGVHENKWL